jgi:hypothetical protein
MPVFLGALEDIRTLNSSMLKELEMCSSPKAALGLISRYAPLFKVGTKAAKAQPTSRLVYDTFSLSKPLKYLRRTVSPGCSRRGRSTRSTCRSMTVWWTRCCAPRPEGEATAAGVVARRQARGSASGLRWDGYVTGLQDHDFCMLRSLNLCLLCCRSVSRTHGGMGYPL